MEIETFSSAFFCFYFFNKCDVVLHFFDSTQQFEFDEQIEVLLDALNDPKVRDPLTLVVVTKTVIDKFFFFILVTVFPIACITKRRNELKIIVNFGCSLRRIWNQ